MTVEFFLNDAWPFTLALLIMALLGVVELIGLGAGALELDFVDIDHDGHPDNQLLDWLGVGSLPILVVFVTLLAVFGATGIAIQSLLGLPVWLASIFAAGATIPIAGVVAGLLAKIWPRDETTAISLDYLIGKRATVISKSGKKGQSAEAKVRDFFGQTHYISLEPHGDTELQEGDVVLLVSREGTLFRGIDPTGGFRTE